MPHTLALQTPRPSVVAPTEQPADDAIEPPTVANYQRVAAESPERLDELLSRAGKPPAASTPVCTAATTSLNF